MNEPIQRTEPRAVADNLDREHQSIGRLILGTAPGMHAAERASSLARRSAIVAFDLYRRALPDGVNGAVGPGWVAPGTSGPPQLPTLSALADLGALAFAGAEMLEIYGSSGSDDEIDQRVAAVEAAERAATAATVAVAGPSHGDGGGLWARAAHAAAQTTHLAAQLLHSDEPQSPLAGRPKPGRPPVFPASRRALLRSLSEQITEAQRREPRRSDQDPIAHQLISAAAAARDAAMHTMSAYDACTVSSPACRFARIAMRAACNAGFAALGANQENPTALA